MPPRTKGQQRVERPEVDLLLEVIEEQRQLKTHLARAPHLLHVKCLGKPLERCFVSLRQGHAAYGR